MATSWSQRKALGRRYSVDPALQYELARLQYEYNLAPTRSAQAAQRDQFAKNLDLQKQNQAQQESQYARGLELQRQKMAMEGEQYNKSLQAQQEQFAASMAESQARHAEQMALAQQQYQLAAQAAKDEKELALAQQRLAEQQAAANQQLQQDQIKAQEQAAIYGTVGNVALLGTMMYGKEIPGAVRGLYGAAKGLFGGGTAAAETAPAAATGMSGVTGGQTIGTGAPTFTANPNLLYGSPATTDIATGAGTFGGGTVTPTVAPAGMTTIPDTAVAPTGISGGVTDFSSMAGSADASWAAQQAAQQAAINEGIAAGADVGLGYGGAIGAGEAAGANVGMGASGATWGTALGTVGSAVSTAVPYVGAATIGMPILGNVLERGFESAFGIEPGSSNVFAQANTITGENYHRPIEAATNLLGIETPEWVEAIFNPGGWALGALGLCFLAGTKVEMEDGTTKNVEDIKIGDRMKEGGMVTGRGEHLSGDLYDYQGVKVTGSHAVFDGEWMRVENTLKATQIALKEPVTVYILDNQKHRIIIDGIVFSDFTEIDGSENMLPEDRIHHMNRRDGVKIQAYDHPFHYRRSHRPNRMQANPVY